MSQNPNPNLPKLVLSNTTTFFAGNIEAVFKKAEKYGFQYIELIPYRWIKPEKVYHLSRKYDVKIAGVHMPPWWSGSLRQALRSRHGFLEKAFTLLWNFYLGGGRISPARDLTKLLTAKRQSPFPYLLFHANLVYEMGKEFDKLARQFHVVIENVPYHKKDPEFFWNPVVIQKEIKKRNLSAGLVFDPSHYLYTLRQLSHLNMLSTYQQLNPEIVHIGYDHFPALHALPNLREQKELKKILQIRQPKYIVIETNPLISVSKAKEMMEKLIS